MDRRIWLGFFLALLISLSVSQAEEPKAADTADKAPADAQAIESAALGNFLKSLYSETFATDHSGALRDLDSGDVQKVNVALEVLGATKAPEAIPYIVPFTDSRNGASLTAGLNLERIVSTIELHRRDMSQPGKVILQPKGPKDIDLTPLRPIVRLMLKQKDPSIESYAATMAGYIGLPDLEPELRALLKSPHPCAIRSATNALEIMGFVAEDQPSTARALVEKRLLGNDGNTRARITGIEKARDDLFERMFPERPVMAVKTMDANVLPAMSHYCSVILGKRPTVLIYEPEDAVAFLSNKQLATNSGEALDNVRMFAFLLGYKLQLQPPSGEGFTPLGGIDPELWRMTISETEEDWKVIVPMMVCHDTYQCIRYTFTISKKGIMKINDAKSVYIGRYLE